MRILYPNVYTPNINGMELSPEAKDPGREITIVSYQPTAEFNIYECKQDLAFSASVMAIARWSLSPSLLPSFSILSGGKKMQLSSWNFELTPGRELGARDIAMSLSLLLTSSSADGLWFWPSQWWQIRAWNWTQEVMLCSSFLGWNYSFEKHFLKKLCMKIYHSSVDVKRLPVDSKYKNIY